MKSICDCLVVGGGISGLTSTAYLSKYGYKTILCEAGPKLGGLIGTFERNGYIFDQGIRAFENSGILFPMLSAFDIKLDLVKNPVKLGLVDDFVDLSQKDFLNEYGKMLSKYYPEESRNIEKIIEKIQKVMDQMDVLYEIDNPIFIEGKYELNYVFKTLLPWLKRYKKSMKDSKEFQTGVVNYLKKYTSDQSLIDIITQHFFERTPAFFALSYFGFYRDYQYPIGGTGVLIEKLENYILSKGTEVKKETRIVKIDSKLNIATTSNGDEIHYKKLIWAANQKSLYENLVELPNKKTSMMKKEVSVSRGSDSVLSLYIGTNLDINLVKNVFGPHAFYTAFIEGISKLGQWQASNDLENWIKEFLKYTTYEISTPVIRDISLAPRGEVGLIISTLFSYDLTKHFKDNHKLDLLKKIVTETIIDILEKSILPGLKSSILFSNISTPLTIESFTSNLDGSITGWSYANDFMPAITDFTYIRNAVETPIKNIFQAGQWTFSPAGMPTSVLTGKVSADKVIKGKYKT